VTFVLESEKLTLKTNKKTDISKKIKTASTANIGHEFPQLLLNIGHEFSQLLLNIGHEFPQLLLKQTGA
jgi:hypothetical protein